MLKLSKYLKPFLFGLVLCVLLLVVQAICDLSLPDFMADIVSVGIQKKGIETAAVNAVSTDAYALTSIFLTEPEKTFIDSCYTKKSIEEKDYKKRYPGAKDSLYVLNESVTQEQKEEIDRIFSTGTGTLFQTIKILLPEGAAAPTSDGEKELKLSDFYEMEPVFQALPPAVIADARKQAEATDDMIKRNMGAMMAQAFYQELGVDVGAVSIPFF